ncbi:glycosyltransferase [Synechococcus sp. AH-551-G15]|nr:glycosyltransferase [Synechococcus sp. AH-551-G15]
MTSQPLKGLRLVVSGFELEQSEHRGIAVFTKNLLRTLKQLGAEVWLLTEYSPDTKKIKKAKLPAAVGTTIFSAEVLEKLNSTETSDSKLRKFQKILSRLPFLQPLFHLQDRELRQQMFQQVFPGKYIKAKALKIIPKSELLNSPYQRSERLSYLTDIEGLICAKSCFQSSMSLAKRKSEKHFTINFKGFDGFISTSPLNLIPEHCPLFLQTVHDLIPLQYQRTRDDLPCFTRRLITASQARRWFVSNDAEKNYNSAILSAKPKRFEPLGSVLTQPPSLQFPGDALDWESRTDQLQVPCLSKQQTHRFRPLSYFLFNSSVAPHKNLLFALKAFMESGVEHLGIQFCITGKPQKDDYSKEVKAIADNNPNIVFTGYVNEATKRQLYLNALALVSPSLIEGFGIPVLDAACLGMKAIASPLGSHQEIHNMHDFDQHILLCSTIQTSDWASAMRLTTQRHQQELNNQSERYQQLKLNDKRQQRILRYRHYQALVEQAFSDSVCSLIIQ